MSITYKVNQDSKGQYYSSLKITEIKEANASFIPVQKALYVSFISPIRHTKTDIFFAGKYTEQYDINIDTCKKIYKDHYHVVFHISLKSGEKFSVDTKETITIEFNPKAGEADVTNLDACMKTIAIAADKIPSIGGTINLIAAKAPSVELKDVKIDVDFSYDTKYKSYSQNVLPGHNASLDVFDGKYSISAPEIHNHDGTIYSEITCTPSTIEVTTGSHKDVHIGYGKQTKYSVLHFIIAKIKHLDGWKFKVSIKADNFHKTFITPAQDLATFHKLPATGTLTINIESINNNNKLYSFNPKNITLSGKVETVQITEADFNITNINDHDFSPLTLKIVTELELPNNFQLLHLTKGSAHYSTFIEIKNNNAIKFPVNLETGEYEVSCANFISNKIVYAIKCPEKLKIVSGMNSLELNIKKGANLVVRGFPNNALTFGGCTTLEPSNLDHFLEAMPSSIFKYAGTKGDGNPNDFLATDDSTTHTIEKAKQITDHSSLHQHVLPVMISYTINFSGGDKEVLGISDEAVKKQTTSLANYILTLTLLNAEKTAKNPVPGGIILNPDFLCSLLEKHIEPTQHMKVNKVFTEAIKLRANLLHTLPPVPTDFTEDVKGYIEALNWLTHTIAPDITYGWQVNLWGMEPRGAVWLYDAEPKTEYIVKILEDHLNKFGVYNGKYKPDFLAVDRFEADDLTKRSYQANYCYGPKEWDAYFKFCSVLSSELKVPIMPWQIPCSRTPLLNDKVNDDFDAQHWGTAANYILGDEALGSKVENIHPTVRNFSFKGHGIATYVGNTPGDMYKRKKDFDVSTPAYLDFPLKGIFHVELGGGSTVGMVPALATDIDLSWSNNKLKAYAKKPVSFADTLSHSKGE